MCGDWFAINLAIVVCTVLYCTVLIGQSCHERISGVDVDDGGYLSVLYVTEYVVGHYTST